MKIAPETGSRFKGLGEISPKEFAQFIGKEMRLSKVEYAPKTEISGRSVEVLPLTAFFWLNSPRA